VTSLKIEKEVASDRAMLLAGMLAGLDNTYKNLLNGNKRALINGWLSLNCTIGNNIMVRDRDRTITGIAENIGKNGELIVRLESGGTEVISAGDVTILKN
jgi:biotin-(acetyl-CoA carboxylase) ligase